MKKQSWKTSLSGIFAGLAILLAQAITLTDSDPLTNPEYTQIVAAIGLIVMGLNARDNDVTSEQAGAKR